MIYLAIASDGYESKSVIKAFESEYEAKEFTKACDDHTALQPPCPPHYEDSPEGRRQHDEWDAAHDAWKNKHPAPYFSFYDSFYVIAVPLVAATLTKENHGQ